jgi:hypothetical protein
MAKDDVTDVVTKMVKHNLISESMEKSQDSVNWFLGEKDSLKRKNGRGIYMNLSEGWVSIQRFKNNISHGKFMTIRSNGNLEMGTKVNGKIQGDF